MNKIFLISLPLALLGAVTILFLSTKKLPDDAACGCGPPSPEEAGEYQEAVDNMPVFNNQSLDFWLAKLTPSLEALKQETVLGTTTDERWIEVDLSEQRLRAWEGTKLAYEFLISSGKWARTPTGEYRVWVKLRYTKMSGGSRKDHTYYYLPNVPYTQYFYKGYGLHGTYWHQNFGQPMSHGCVNLSIPDAEKLFYWTAPVIPRSGNVIYSSKDNPGTKVVIHE